MKRTTGGLLRLATVSILAAGCASSPSSPSAAATAPTTASPPASQVAAVIPDGRYVGKPQQVAAILDGLHADTTLTDGEKDSIVDDVLGIRSATTFQSAIEVRNGAEFVGSQRIDNEPFEGEDAWPLAVVDDTTITLRIPCCGVQSFEVRRANDAFTIKAVSPASSNVEAFVRGIVFESSPFTRAP